MRGRRSPLQATCQRIASDSPRAQHVYHSDRFSRHATTRSNLHPGCLRSCDIGRDLAIVPNSSRYCEKRLQGKNVMANGTVKLALLWPRDVPKWNAAVPHEYRLNRVFEEMAALGIEAEPAIYADDVADQVREQLLRCDGVLVWVDPLFAGQDRSVLDAMLRDVASKGVDNSTSGGFRPTEPGSPPPSWARRSLSARRGGPRSRGPGSRCASGWTR